MAAISHTAMSEDDRSAGVLAVAVTFLTLTWIVVPLRIYVRTVLTKAFGLDDVLLIITQVNANLVESGL